MFFIDDYGQLLDQMGFHRRAAIYCRRRLKQIELGKAVEGPFWRNCHCLQYQYYVYTDILYKCCHKIGQPVESLQTLENLLHFHISTSMFQNNHHYYELLYNGYAICYSIKGKSVEQNRYKD